MPFREIITALESETGIKFNELFCKEYDVIPPNKKKEPVRTSLQDIDDLKDYFVEQEGRRYYRYIDYRFHSDKAEDQLKDFLIVEEQTPSGVIVAIFDYLTDPYKKKEVVLFSGRQKVPFLNLRNCYAVKIDDNNRANAQAIDLMGFWQRKMDPLAEEEKETLRRAGLPFHRAQRDEEKTVQGIGLLPQNIEITPQDQINLVKEDGRLFFQDSDSPTRWLDRLLPAAAFSQGEGDKAVTYDRNAMFLGMIRKLLGETRPLEDLIVDLQLVLFKKAHDIISSDENEILQKNIILETREWIRNRLAVALYIPLRLRRLGFDLIPKEEYRNFTATANKMLENLTKG